MFIYKFEEAWNTLLYEHVKISRDLHKTEEKKKVELHKKIKEISFLFLVTRWQMFLAINQIEKN